MDRGSQSGDAGGRDARAKDDARRDEGGRRFGVERLQDVARNAGRRSCSCHAETPAADSSRHGTSEILVVRVTRRWVFCVVNSFDLSLARLVGRDCCVDCRGEWQIVYRRAGRRFSWS
jgi:hypothetical protein